MVFFAENKILNIYNFFLYFVPFTEKICAFNDKRSFSYFLIIWPLTNSSSIA